MTKPLIIAKGPEIASFALKEKKYEDADFRKIDSPEKVRELRNDIAQKIKDFGYVKLIAHAHGNNGQIYFYEDVNNFSGPKNDYYVTSLFRDAQVGEALAICQIFSCQAGSMKAKGEDAKLSINRSSHQYLTADKNIFFIIHSGKHVTSAFLANEYINLTYKERDPAKIMLDAIVHYDDTVKFIHDKKVFKSDRLKPQIAQDLTDEKIREFLSDKIDKFLEFFEQKLKKIDATKRKELAKEYKEKLTSKHISKYRSNSCISYFLRESHLISEGKIDDKNKKPYIQAYLKFGKGLIEASHSYTPLLKFLAQTGYEDEVKKLLENYPDIKERSLRQETALHLAVEFGFHDAVKALIAKGIDVNARDKDGLTALEHNFKNDQEILRTLVEAGSNVSGNIEKDISLHEACQKGYVKVVQAIFNERDETSNFRFRESCEKNKNNLDRKNSQGETALDIAKRFGQKEVEKFLLQEELIQAVARGEEDKVKELLKEVDVNFVSKEGLTLFHYALFYCQKDCPEILEDLLKVGVEIPFKVKDNIPSHGRNSLHEAIACTVSYNKKETLRVLLDAIAQRNSLSGANYANNYGDLIIEVANEPFGPRKGSFQNNGWKICREFGFEKAEKILLAGVLEDAISSNKIEEVRAALKEGANPRVEDFWKKNNALHQAVRKKDVNIEIVKAILETGLNIDLVSGNSGRMQKNALYQAVKVGNAEVVKVLLENGADIFAESNGSLVFHAFFKRIEDKPEFVHQPKILKLLIENLLQKGPQAFSKAREEVIEVGKIFKEPQFIEKFDQCVEQVAEIIGKDKEGIKNPKKDGSGKEENSSEEEVAEESKAEEILPSAVMSPTLTAIGIGNAAQLKIGSSKTSKSK